MRHNLLTCLALLFSWAALPAWADMQLIMVEETGCMWCARWNQEVGPEYPVTAEGRLAPLRRIELNDPVPEDLVLDGKLRLTPTFVLVRDGQEIARLEGYPGEDFFWALIDRMLTEAGAELDDAAG